MRYKILRSTYRGFIEEISDVIAKLEKDVNIEISLGYVPAGGLAATVTEELQNPSAEHRQNVITFWQAMYKPED